MNYKIKRSRFILILIIAALLSVPSIVGAKGIGSGKRKTAKVSAQQVGMTAININNINAPQYLDGSSDHNPNGNLEGTEFPKGSQRNICFEGGFLWGGFVPGDPQVRVGGSTYASGLEAGPIQDNGQPADPSDPNWSMYRVRPDVYPGGPAVDLSGDAASLNYWNPGAPVSADQVRAQYLHDWMYWPAHGNPTPGAVDLGAPFTDVNHDGKYEPDIDIPGVPGADQTVFYVVNDEDPNLTQGLYGALPLGLEVHETQWAYAQQGALGNMYFKKWQIINKGYQHYTIDSMFVAYWTDVDLGDASDDLVGCDSALSLQYAYNSQPTDAVYQPLPPPCIGFDFFEGPKVPGNPTDSAIFNGRVNYGYKNLPMYAAFTFTNPGSGSAANFNDPDLGKIGGSTQMFNFMLGLDRNGAPILNPMTGLPSRFIFSGDPVTFTGWVDGGKLPAGAVIPGGISFPGRDIRQGMSAGPFTMAPGDTQEIVVAEICAGATPSVNYLQAINLMKTYDKTAQGAFDHFFQIPSAPPAPLAVGIAQSNKIIINWGQNADRVNATESSVIPNTLDPHGNSLVFEGYNVYQLPTVSASIDQAHLLATFDVVDGITTIPYTDPVTGVVEPSIIIQHGSDSGIQRFFVDSTDSFNGNKPLNNGTPYYFAVTAYSYDSTGNPQSLESPITVITVVPQGNAPGVRYTYGAQDTIHAVHTSGKSDGSVYGIVVDPTQLNGHQFKVSFDTLGGNYVWNLQDVTANKTILTDQTNQSGNNNYQEINGVLLKVYGPPVAINNWSATGDRWVSGTNWGGSQFFGGMDLGANFFGSNLGPSDYVPVEMKWTGGSGVSTPSVANGWSQGAVYWRSDSYKYHGVGWMPFQSFDISDPANPVQINDSFVEDANAGSANLQWDMGWNGTAFAANGGREYIFINKTPYNPNYYNGTIDGTTTDVLYAIWPSARGSQPYLEGKFTLTIVPNYANTQNDVFTLTETAPTKNVALEKEDVNKINVFPNPYYGVNYLETTKYQRFVTFSHLPNSATIRIFNLAGIQVKEINHTKGNFEQWDLTNESGLPVASGLYIAYIDMPQIGSTKILKFAIIQEQQIPDHF